MALLAGLTILAGCSDLGNQADATIRIDAQDRNQALQLRQELLQQAPSWGGVRVGEDTAEKEGEISLTFSLPGRNLDAAIGGIQSMDADVDSTSIDVEREDVERTTTTASSSGSSSQTADDGEITLRVDVTAAPEAAGAGAVLRLLMAIFSVIGMVATALWISQAWKRRFGREDPPRPRRRIGGADLDDVDVDLSDPPTQETPRVPREPWN